MISKTPILVPRGAPDGRTAALENKHIYYLEGCLVFCSDTSSYLRDPTVEVCLIMLSRVRFAVGVAKHAARSTQVARITAAASHEHLYVNINFVDEEVSIEIF